MKWFSVWLPLTTQLLIPLALIVWLARAGGGSKARLIATAALAAAYVVAIAIGGLWLVLPWWMPFAYGAAILSSVVARWRRLDPVPTRAPGFRGRVATLTICALAVLFLGVTERALAGREPPVEPIDVAFPMKSGTYMVVNGGSQVLINAHLNTLDGERFVRYRGQSYGVDLVRINSAGLRVRGVLPPDPAAYFIYGDPVVAPCDGRVIVAEDGAPDRPPPQPDRSHMVGNHVILECGPVWIVLGHLQRGTVAVQTGDLLERGRPLGRVGNSGNTGEPHLHIHAQRPGSPTAPLGGDPVPIRLDGQYLVRNDRVTMTR